MLAVAEVGDEKPSDDVAEHPEHPDDGGPSNDDNKPPVVLTSCLRSFIIFGRVVTKRTLWAVASSIYGFVVAIGPTILVWLHLKPMGTALEAMGARSSFIDIDRCRELLANTTYPMWPSLCVGI